MHDVLLISCLLVCVVSFYLIFIKYYNKVALLQSRVTELEKENLLLKAQHDFTVEQYKTFEQKFKLQFESYTEQLLKNKSDILQKETTNTITGLLNPLKDKINEFQQKVERTYQDESREIFSLKNEINKLVVNNFNMAKETLNLTNALKGNVKAQGIWGEIILDKVLEHSGLREGIEYIKQGSNLQLKNEDDKIMRPDVIINLPDHKHLVIDAKVSLVNYQQHISSMQANDDGVEQDHLKLFIKSIQNHIVTLSNKNYQHNDQLLSPDFVMLFFPIEGAFSLALQVMPELLTQAFNHKIIIVSPTTLLATLKTIASIWLVDKQNKNAMQIALESGLLYDKFVGFTEDLVAIGQAINKVDTCYHAALNKLSQGKGNLIAKAEKIRELGAKAKKKIEYNLQNNLIHSENDNDKHKHSSYNSFLGNTDAINTEMELGDD